MAPADVAAFVGRLESAGLTFLRDEVPLDIVVVDQMTGPTRPCEWLQFTRIPFQGGGLVSMCWLFEGERFGPALYVTEDSLQMHAPDGWRFEGSFSENPGFVPTEAVEGRLRFLHGDGALDVYLDVTTGKEVYVGRTG